jgi:hypothetical protein
MLVFYSWQSDLPNATNRAFIDKALERAAQAMRKDIELAIEPVIDRDTVGLPGAPDIGKAIFDKIDRCDVFVADVSIVRRSEGSRPTPNPNVLVELGYALKSLGHERILLVINSAFGGPELLPFDLRQKRALSYQLESESDDKANIRKEFATRLEAALRAFVPLVSAAADERLSTTERTLKRLLADPNGQIALSEALSTIATAWSRQLAAANVFDVQGSATGEEVRKRVTEIDTRSNDAVVAAALVGRFSQPTDVRTFCQLVTAPAHAPVHGSRNVFLTRFRRFPITYLLYAAGLGALSAERYDILRILLRDLQLKLVDERDRLPFALAFHPIEIFEDNGRVLYPNENRFAPVSDHLHDVLCPNVAQLLYLSFEQFTVLFDTFEFLWSLVWADLTRTDELRAQYVPWGAFVWRRSTEAMSGVAAELDRRQAGWGPIASGLLPLAPPEAANLVATVRERLAATGRRLGVMW